MQEILESLESLTANFANLVWGTPLVFFLCFTSIFFTVMLGFPQFRHFREAIDIIRGKSDKNEDKGEISHFQALCTALSATVGLGNISGVAIAVSIGGPGGVFWLWVAGFFGMATKFAEVTLACHYRETSGVKIHGGPMFTIKNGLSKTFTPMAWIYAFLVIFASFGMGNMFQANQMAQILSTSLNVPTWLSGSAFSLMAALTLIGGIKRIGKVTSKLIPFMIGLYLLGAIGILVVNFKLLPSILTMIFSDAFTGTAAVGGFAGVAVKEAIISGIRRATFSNEAGLGSSAIAHAAAKSTPVQEGIVALMEPFIDTIIVCSLTALVILSTGAWHQGGLAGSEMTASAFESIYGPFGRGIVILTVVLFAFSTVISWSYYGEQGVVYILGEKYVLHYRCLFIALILVGSVVKLEMAMNLSDAFNGLLAIPNLIATYLLLSTIKGLIRDHDAGRKSG